MPSASLTFELNPPAKEAFPVLHANPHKLGLAVGTLLAAWHALWSVLVWTGAAQPVLNFVFRLHMIAPPFQVAQFNLGTAAALVLITAAFGYAAGWGLGWMWNRFGPRTVE